LKYDLATHCLGFTYLAEIKWFNMRSSIECNWL